MCPLVFWLPAGTHSRGSVPKTLLHSDLRRTYFRKRLASTYLQVALLTRKPRWCSTRLPTEERSTIPVAVHDLTNTTRPTVPAKANRPLSRLPLTCACDGPNLLEDLDVPQDPVPNGFSTGRCPVAAGPPRTCFAARRDGPHETIQRHRRIHNKL